ncbi:type 1 glutamine amidotransferase domain-containing protein [Halioglobus japonicus]|uniref:Type 1 glutamine amidotransferase domain-containing protein n=2 Tax=Halioglobus japonicus TaxID=930805 RepID=A0AAP8MDC3_9GAMM|nr:type 1 glutamine amidotransferase domain-containing protein [Halioglobus japonicus]PLW85723.1 type 1 glutamine amidotransferase domain-containing protein [Halioglobus japonicus]
MNVLMVLTSHDKLGDTGEKTGFWLEEFAAPYYRMLDAGVELTIASPAGGQPPLAPKSDAPDAQTDAAQRFTADTAAQAVLAGSRVLAELDVADFDAFFYPGGHGPLWDLTEDVDSIALIENALAQGKPVAAVCHAPAVLIRATVEGEPMVKGRRVTGFTNSEEAAVGLTDVVPFLLEDRLHELGGNFSAAADWEPHVVVDGLLITGQNPASSAPVADALIDAIGAGE